MKTKLTEIIARQIAMNGPVDVGTFMALALAHPQHGYYMSRDPFGARGDFTTAPEISQMFGELIGAWCADLWAKMGGGDFIWLECGPGRGTLMRDALRATKAMPGFHTAASVHFLEIGPVLRDMQGSALEGVTPQWHDSLASLPTDRPILAVANEFLDVLPVRQLQKTDKGWQEIVIGLENENLVLGAKDFPQNIEMEAPEGAVIEFSPAREAFVKDLAYRIKQQGGAALMIDYGQETPGPGSSIRAIHKHNDVHFLDHAGEADVSANVNFGDLAKAAREEGVHVRGPVPQGKFLQNLGIGQRAVMLAAKADQAQQEEVEKALQRLTAPDQMGALFKVMGLFADETITPAGF